jgi:hypothetical protein
LISADAGRVRVAGHDLARDPDAIRAAIGVTGQFSAVDNLLTGDENLMLMADLHHLDRSEGRRRAADLLEHAIPGSEAPWSGSRAAHVARVRSPAGRCCNPSATASGRVSAMPSLASTHDTRPRMP